MDFQWANNSTHASSNNQQSRQFSNELSIVYYLINTHIWVETCASSSTLGPLRDNQMAQENKLARDVSCWSVFIADCVVSAGYRFDSGVPNGFYTPQMCDTGSRLWTGFRPDIPV